MISLGQKSAGRAYRPVKQRILAERDTQVFGDNPSPPRTRVRTKPETHGTSNVRPTPRPPRVNLET
jgi:hypothetical protein